MRQSLADRTRMSMLVFCTSGRELESIAWPPWNGLIPSENAPRRVVAALRRNVSSELEKAPQIVIGATAMAP